MARSGWVADNKLRARRTSPGEAVSKDPQHLMADGRLEAIQGQDDPTLGLGDALQAGGIGEGQGQQFVVALEQMRDRPRGDGQPRAGASVHGCRADSGAAHSAGYRRMQ